MPKHETLLDLNSTEKSKETQLGINKKIGKIHPVPLTAFSPKDGAQWDKVKGLAVRAGEILYSSSNPLLHKHGARILGKPKPTINGKIESSYETCADMVSMAITESKKAKARSFFTCKVRTCPICSRNKAYKQTFRALKRMEEFIKNPNTPRVEFLFVTLTIDNPPVGELRYWLTRMNQAFNRLRQYPFWQEYVLGFIKKTEVTQGEGEMMAHPHFHLILAVDPTYYAGRQYALSKDRLQQIWGQAMQVGHDLICDIEAVKPNARKKKTSLEASLFELLKYEFKVNNTLIDNPEWFLTYAEQTHKLRFISSGGLLKDIVKEDLTDEELEEIQTEMMEELEKTDPVQFVRWFKFWEKKGKYFLYE